MLHLVADNPSAYLIIQVGVGGLLADDFPDEFGDGRGTADCLRGVFGIFQDLAEVHYVVGRPRHLAHVGLQHGNDALGGRRVFSKLFQFGQQRNLALSVGVREALPFFVFFLDEGCAVSFQFGRATTHHPDRHKKLNQTADPAAASRLTVSPDPCPGTQRP